MKRTRSRAAKVDGGGLSPKKRLPAEAPNDSLKKDFFDVPCAKLAIDLLGKKLVRRMQDETRLEGVIVETEAYLGGDDKASHSYKNKRTPRNAAMYMGPGTIYVYHIYGAYTCLNFSSKGDGAAVLVRALRPLSGMDEMRRRRGQKRADRGAGLKVKDLTNGPSKLTQALDITKELNQQAADDSGDLWLEEGPEPVAEDSVVRSARIGIDYAGEWAKTPLRFYIGGDECVSVRDRLAEQQERAESAPAEAVAKHCGASASSTMAPSTSTSASSSTTKRKEIIEELNRSQESRSEKVAAWLWSNSHSDEGEDIADASLPNGEFTLQAKPPPVTRLSAEFFDRDCLVVARDLLGQHMVRTISGRRLVGKIVEVEAYLGTEDGSCHCYGKKRTAKTEPMFMPPGTAYVYTLYYGLCCFNISTHGAGCVVLIRAVQPLEEVDVIKALRETSSKSSRNLSMKNLANGPGKLCQAFSIDKATFNAQNLCENKFLWFERQPEVAADDVGTSSRIGIEKTPPEFASKPWRFYLRNNVFVSREEEHSDSS